MPRERRVDQAGGPDPRPGQCRVDRLGEIRMPDQGPPGARPAAERAASRSRADDDTEYSQLGIRSGSSYAPPGRRHRAATRSAGRSRPQADRATRRAGLCGIAAGWAQGKIRSRTTRATPPFSRSVPDGVLSTKSPAVPRPSRSAPFDEVRSATSSPGSGPMNDPVPAPLEVIRRGLRTAARRQRHTRQRCAIHWRARRCPSSRTYGKWSGF